MRAVALSEHCSVVSTTPDRNRCRDKGRSRPIDFLGKAAGMGKIREWAPIPPLGVGVTARMEGMLKQSREGLGGSPYQVVGQRSAE